MEVWGIIIGSVLGGGTVATIISAIVNRSKTKAEGRSAEVRGELQIVGSAVEIVNALREDLTRLSDRVEEVNAEAIVLRKIASDLTEKVHDLELENQRLLSRCEASEAENQRLLRDRE